MTAFTIAENIPLASGDWTLRGVDTDQIFASQQLSDAALTAAVRTTARFDPSFPGWQLYRRVVAGVGLFDRQLEAWAIGTARALSRMHKRNGREYIKSASRRPDWIAQAARDALDYAIYGRYPAGLGDRADYFRVSPKTYQAIRDPIATCMIVGLETFAAELRSQFIRIRNKDFFDNGTEPKSHVILGVRDMNCSDEFAFMCDGNYIRTKSIDSSYL